MLLQRIVMHMDLYLYTLESKNLCFSYIVVSFVLLLVHEMIPFITFILKETMSADILC